MLALDEAAIHVAVADHRHLQFANQLLIVVHGSGEVVLQFVIQIEAELEGGDVVAIRFLYEAAQVLLVYLDGVRIQFVKYVQDDDAIAPAMLEVYSWRERKEARLVSYINQP